jgi:membrane-bound lytic murein transglycosylase F
MRFRIAHGTLELIWLVVLGLTLLLLPFPFPSTSKFEAVREAGKLVVATVNGPTTYYEGPEGPMGFDYELAAGFARHLGVDLDLRVYPGFSEILPLVTAGEVDLAAAGAAVSPARMNEVRYSPPYQEVRHQVVYHRGADRPRRPADLVGRDLQVVAGRSFVDKLTAYQAEYPQLSWTEVADMSMEELLIEVWEGLVELTIADSNLVAVVRQFYPEIHVAFSLPGTESLAWVLPLSDDNSLYLAAADYIEAMERSGDLARLRERYYGPATRSNYLDVTTYQRRIESILPQFQDDFIEAGRKYGLDWRLIAAQAYQESKWDPDAVSPTGVRGLMMITLQTAEHLGIDDRVDVKTSIDGGAQYLRDLYDRLPERIVDPDRTWLALAAYNIGMGHLEDARVLTAQQGGNPDKWADVRERLPLLAKQNWYPKTRHGYARGYEPVQYVSRIRTFYDILAKLDEQKRSLHGPDPLRIEAPAL